MPTLGGTVANVRHFMMGVCCASAYGALFHVIVRATPLSTGIAIPIWAFVVIYAKQPILATKVHDAVVFAESVDAFSIALQVCYRYPMLFCCVKGKAFLLGVLSTVLCGPDTASMPRRCVCWFVFAVEPRWICHHTAGPPVHRDTHTNVLCHSASRVWSRMRVWPHRQPNPLGRCGQLAGTLRLPHQTNVLVFPVRLLESWCIDDAAT